MVIIPFVAVVVLNMLILLLECIASSTNANLLVFLLLDLVLSLFFLILGVSEVFLCVVTVLKFGHMSSDLLAYGASDGTLTVCTLSEEPSVLKQLTGHSKDVTGSTHSYSFCILAT